MWLQVNDHNVTAVAHSQIVDLLKVQHSGINIVALRSTRNHRHDVVIDSRDVSCLALPADVKHNPSCLNIGPGTLSPVVSKANPLHRNISALSPIDNKATDGKASATESVSNEMVSKSATSLPLVQRMSRTRDSVIKRSKTGNCVSASVPTPSSLSTLSSCHVLSECHVVRKTDCSINNVTPNVTADVTDKHLLEVKTAMDSYPVEVCG